MDRRDMIRFIFAVDSVSANVAIKYARMLQFNPAPIARSFELTLCESALSFLGLVSLLVLVF